MALGSPSITTPSSLSLRAVQQAIANINERFRQTDRAITALGSASGAAQGAASSTLLELRALIGALTLRVTALEGGGGSGSSVTLTAASSIAQGDPVRYVAGGQCDLIDPDDLTACGAYIGVAAAGASAGADVVVKIIGEVQVLNASFDVGYAVYAAVGGGLTQDPPGNALPVGVATSIDSVGVGGTGGGVALRTRTMLTGVSSRDDSLPITYGLAREIGGGVVPVVTGEVPPVFVYLDDGSVVYVGV